MKSDENREMLRKLLYRSLNGAIRKLLGEKGFSEDSIVACAVSGNVYISHSLLGLPLGALARFPFSPPLTDLFFFPDEIPLSMRSSGCIMLFPSDRKSVV